MRREDREVKDVNSIFDILERCTVIRVCLFDSEYPYVIPMTFGAELVNGEITIYFHSAQSGKKNTLLSLDNRVSVEADLYYRTEESFGGITAKYESVIGSGNAIKLEEVKDKVHGLKVILDHYNRTGFPVESCKGLSKCDVYAIKLKEVSGKHNIWKERTPSKNQFNR